MVQHHSIHDPGSPHADPKFGRLLLASMVLHVLVVVLVGGFWMPHVAKDRRPVYYVDLINKPVAKPQAGRPDARPVAKPEAKPKPVEKKVVKPQPQPAPQPKPKPAAVKKPAPKPTVSKNQETDLQKKLSAMKEKQARGEERQALKDKLAALSQKDSRSGVAATTPVGALDGQGDEVGVETIAFVQQVIQNNWTLSPYLLANRARADKIQARALVVYSAEGVLQHYKILEKSGDPQFDKSLQEAIVKSKQLPQPLPGRQEFQVVFNLKDIQDMMR